MDAAIFTPNLTPLETVFTSIAGGQEGYQPALLKGNPK